MKPIINLGYAGRYRLSATRRDGKVRDLTGWFDNLITNHGLDTIGNAQPGEGTLPSNIPGICLYAFVGTGTAEPDITDVQLESWLATSTANSSPTYSYVAAAEAAPPYWRMLITYRFNEGVATGNLSEVGVGMIKSGLFSRSLIRDESDAPTTITVRPDESLDVTYELRCYINLDDVATTQTISGVTYDVTIRALGITTAPPLQRAVYYNAAMQTLSTDVLPPAENNNSAGNKYGTWEPYTNGTFYRDITLNRDLSEDNFAGGIGSARMTTSIGKWQWSFSPKIPKDATKKLSLPYRVSWGRYTP